MISDIIINVQNLRNGDGVLKVLERSHYKICDYNILSKNNTVGYRLLVDTNHKKRSMVSEFQNKPAKISATWLVKIVNSTG